MQPLSQRAQEMGLPMTIEMAQKARELSATGKDVISLSLGEILIRRISSKLLQMKR